MSAHDHPTDATLHLTREHSEDRADPLRVRLTAPPLSGVLRIVLLLVATGLGLCLAWRIRGVIQLLVISLARCGACAQSSVPRARPRSSDLDQSHD